MPSRTTQVLALWASAIQIFVLWNSFGDRSWPEELNFFGIPHDFLRLAVYPFFFLGYLLIRADFRFAILILTVAGILAVLLERQKNFMPEVVGAGVLVMWFTLVYPFLLFFRLITRSYLARNNNEAS